MVLKFAGLRDVPFVMHSCAGCCNIVDEKLKERQRQLLKEMDEEYEECMKQAMKDEGISHFKPLPSHSHRATNRRTKKCTIM